ncbi:Slam-dependent surface lipoprotein [Endozoicomonadaceae bacterium StTr2]
MKKITLSIIATAAVLASGLSQADIIGTQSYDDNIKVGKSTVPFGPHTSGKAGVGVGFFKSFAKVDFGGLAKVSDTTLSNDGVYTLTKTPHFSAPSTFNFVKVGSGDVWFGEWANDMSDNGADDGNRSVFYVGDNSGTTMPTNGVATYSVKGVNHYSAAKGNHMTGTLTADFSAGSLNGSMTNGTTTVALYNNTINSSTAAFSGYAVANGTQLGNANGHFFGADAAALAGIAKFDDRKLDTAFGGTKN